MLALASDPGASAACDPTTVAPGGWSSTPRTSTSEGAAAALDAAGIPLLAFELEGARLSDAYLGDDRGAR